MESPRHLGSGLAALVAALVTIGLSAWPALAAGAAVTPSPKTVQVGEPIGLSFTGFKPCSAKESLTVRWDNEPLSVYDVVVGPVGSDSFTADAVVPSSPFGLNQIDAGCSAGTEYLPQEQGSAYVVALSPSVQIVQAGEPVTITGSGFTQCTDPAGSTTVDLSANGTLLATASPSNGDFQQVITVPSATAAGPYAIAAQCSDQPGSDLAATSVSVVTLSLSPSAGTPGTAISVTGGGFTHCREVRLELLQDASGVAVAGRLIGPADGSFTAGVTVPSGAAPGNDYQVDAGCYPAADGATPVAVEQFTVTSPVTTSASPTPGSASASPAQSGTRSPGSASASPPLSSTSPSPAHPSSARPPSPLTATSPQSPGRADGLGVPVALVGGGGAGLALVALVLVRALSMLHASRGRGWVNKHLRVTAGWAGPLPTDVERRPGAAPMSIGLEPHLDHLGDQQQYEEVAR
jgi:hypothetical protein